MSEPGTISIESQWFKISVFAGSAIAAGVTFANIIYYSKLRKDKNMTAIKQSTATTMMWVNIVLFVVSLLLFIWSVWMLLFSRKTREVQISRVKSLAVHTTATAAAAPPQVTQPQSVQPVAVRGATVPTSPTTPVVSQ